MVSSAVLPAPPSLADLLEAAPIALFLDFDGTLVELAPGPDDIKPLPDLTMRMRDVADTLEGRLAIVSGRGIADIEKHVGELGLAAAGSHGSDIRTAEGSPLGDGPAGLPEAIEQRLRMFAAETGLDYEHKPHGGALHFRSRPELETKAISFAESLATEFGWKAQSGKCVIELVAEGASKGTAVFALMREPPFAGSRPFFIGDDLTDEAGFDACRELDGAGILVGTREPTLAQYQLPDVASVHRWLGL